MKIPETPYTVRGILSKYGDTYQLQLRVKEDLQRMELNLIQLRRQLKILKREIPYRC